MREDNGRFLRASGDSRISSSDGCLRIDGKLVIRKIANRFVVQDDEIFGRVADCDGDLISRVAKIASLLNDGRTIEALFIANSAKWRVPEAKANATRKANFNPSEPREDGRWASDDSASDAPAAIDDVQYRGHFHDVVVDDLIKGLASNGSVLIKNVPVMGLNAVLAIPDGASLPKGSVLPYFIEVKTGNDPGFTKDQQQVYPRICIGGHATSLDPRINRLGLIPGVPFPPLKILVVRTHGPGLPMYAIDYCKEIGLGPRS